MKNFKTFILNESILIKDDRKEPMEPFDVLHSSYHGVDSKYEYDKDHRYQKVRNSDVIHTPKYMMFKTKNTKNYKVNHPTDKREGATVSFSIHGGFTVNPTEKKVLFKIDNENSENNRRPNVKLSPDTSFSSYSRTTPILSLGTPYNSHTRSTFRDLTKHIPDFENYTIHNHGTIPEGTPVHKVLTKNTENENWIRNREPLTLYHGTSKNRAEHIIKNGLTPGNRADHEKYIDLRPGYSEHNVYLTHDPDDAANYATRESIHDKSNPVVLKVKVHPKDFGKLRTDEDNINSLRYNANKAARTKFFKKHPEIANYRTPEYYKGSGTFPVDLHYSQFNHDTKKWEGWTDTHDLLKDHPNPEQYKSEIYHNAMKVFHGPIEKLHSAIAFKGSIHPKDISMHSTWKTTSTPGKDPTEEVYNAAHTKMKSTLIRNDK